MATTTTTKTPKPNLLWRSLPWLTSTSLMHDIVSSNDEGMLKEWRNSELAELAAVNVTVSCSNGD